MEKSDLISKNDVLKNVLDFMYSTRKVVPSFTDVKLDTILSRTLLGSILI